MAQLQEQYRHNDAMRPPHVDSAHLRQALSQFATGITVVATRNEQDHWIGLTVNSFNSVSLEPPLVLWSLSKRSRYLATFRQCPHYSISVLAAHQQDISQRFSTRHADRFDQVAHHVTELGLPLISDACAHFECRNRHQYEEGDHVIFIGLVERCSAQGGEPLLYFNSSYARLLSAT
jgi:flavin reductase (DIM6/NTAB) family NADH-FMN oxidoreductase RutF